MSDRTTDVLGTPLTDAEQKLLSAYDTLAALMDEDLSPAAAAGVAEAVASLWQVLNDLALTDDRPGV